MTHFYFSTKELIIKTEHTRLDYKSVPSNWWKPLQCLTPTEATKCSNLCPTHYYTTTWNIYARTKILQLWQECNTVSCTEHFSAIISNDKSWNLLLLLFSPKHNHLSLPVSRYLILFFKYFLPPPPKILKISWPLTEFFCISCSILEENTERSPLSITSANEFTKGE